MGFQIGLIIAFVLLLALVVYMSSKSGSKAAQVEALKAELKKRAEEQERAKRIINNAYSLSADDARRMLHDVANKQR